MTDHPTRSGTALATPAVVGFTPIARTWTTDAACAPATSYAAVPALDGELTVDEEARRTAGTDLGELVHREPSAVLRPGSSADVAAMVRFCREHRIPVSVRGQAHTTFGQGLSDGVVIESRYLDRIHTVGSDRVEVDAGATWKELVAVTVRDGLTPPVLTGYTGLSIGGTLSVGGIGGLVGGLHTGLQVDHVRELEVVTGTGEIVRCSAGERADLFRAVLGGLGRYGVITRAVVELVRAPERARTFTLEYGDNAAFFRDLRSVLDRSGVGHVYGEMFMTEAGPLYMLHATAFYDLPSVPDDALLTSDLSGDPVAVDRGYLEHAFSIDDAIDELVEAVDWNRMVKPWFDVWLPGSTAEACVEEIMGSLSPRDIGQFGAGLIYPQRRALTGTRSPRLPEPDGSEWAFVLDVNTVSDTVEPEASFAEEMLGRNRRMFVRARDAHGARVYPIGSIPLGEQDWRDHFGDTWDAHRAAKRRYDPDGVIASGPDLP